MSRPYQDLKPTFLPVTIFALLCCAVRGNEFGLNRPQQNYDAHYGPVIGIDIGNSNARVGIPSTETPSKVWTIPACVTFTNNGVLVGNDQPTSSSPRNTVCGTQSLLGLKWSDPEFQALLKGLPYKIVDQQDTPMIVVDSNNDENLVSAEDVHGLLFQRLKEHAEDALETNVTNAIVTVPYSYTDKQRQAVKDSAQQANLTILRVLNEPVSAAYANRLDESYAERLILVYDIGASKTDVALVEVDTGVFEVLHTASANVGGDVFVQRVVAHFARVFEKKHKQKFTLNQESMDQLTTASEQAKRLLSSKMSTRLEIGNFYNGLSFNETLTRAKFEELNKDLFEAAIEPVSQVLHGRNISTIDDILLVGGSAYIPKIQARLEEFFGGKKASKWIKLDDVIVTGAARQGSILSNLQPEDILCCVEINPLTLGIGTTRGMFKPIIQRNTPIPTRKSANFTTAIDGQTSMAINIYEGERAFTHYNRFLGQLVLTDIQPAPKGGKIVEVAFEYDYNGNLKIQAIDIDTRQNVTMTTSDTARNKVAHYSDIDKLIELAMRDKDSDDTLREILLAEIGTDISVGPFEPLTITGLPQRDEL